MGHFWTVLTYLHSMAGPGLMLLYPLYASVVAIESPMKVDDEQWLAYWILYSFLTLLEMILAPALEWLNLFLFVLCCLMMRKMRVVMNQDADGLVQREGGFRGVAGSAAVQRGCLHLPETGEGEAHSQIRCGEEHSEIVKWEAQKQVTQPHLISQGLSEAHHYLCVDE